jgi:hypothetical protein
MFKSWQDKELISYEEGCYIRSILLGESNEEPGSCGEKCAIACEFIANLCRENENRETLTRVDGLCEALGSLASDSSAIDRQDVRLQLARAVGNLCYENAQNRNKFERNVIEFLASQVEAEVRSNVESNGGNCSDQDERQRSRASAGALANLASRNDDAGKRVVGASGVLAALTRSICLGSAPMDMAVRALKNCVEEVDGGMAQAVRSGCTATLVDAAVSYRPSSGDGDDAQERRVEACKTLQSMIEGAGGGEAISRLVSVDGALPRFVGAVLGVSAAELADEAAMLEEQSSMPKFANRDPLPRQRVAQLVAGLADGAKSDNDESPLHAAFAELIPQMLDWLEQRADDLVVQRCAATTLGYLCLQHVPHRAAVRERVSSVLAALAARASVDDDQQLQLGLVMVLGNIVDSNEASAALVAGGAHDVLLSVVNVAVDPQVLHLALGSLRNLSLLGANKPLILERSSYAPFFAVLSRTKDAHVLFGVVGVVRSLTSGDDRAARQRQFVDAGGMNAFDDLFDRHFERNQARILFESSRVIAGLVRDGIDIGQGDAERTLLARAVGTLLTSSFDVLRLEAWSALDTLDAGARKATLEQALRLLAACDDDDDNNDDAPAVDGGASSSSSSKTDNDDDDESKPIVVYFSGGACTGGSARMGAVLGALTSLGADSPLSTRHRLASIDFSGNELSGEDVSLVRNAIDTWSRKPTLLFDKQ